MNEVQESEELSEEDLESVAGGTSLCFFVGFGSGPETAACNRDNGNDEGLGACAYVGVGFGYLGHRK